MTFEPDSKSGLVFQKLGDGPPLLLVHGFPLDSSMWHGQLENWAESSTVIAVDLPGFGGSELRDPVMSMDGLADRLAMLLVSLDFSDPVVFCGHSMGGYVGWSFYRRHRERLRGMILCHTRAASDDITIARARRLAARQVLNVGTGRMVDDMLSRLVSPTTQVENPQVTDRLHAIMNSARPRSVSAALLAIAARIDSTPLLAGLDLPVLVVAGDGDTVTPVDEMREMAGQIPGAVFETVTGSGHLSPMEQPEEFNRIVVGFLNRPGPAVSQGPGW